MTNNAYIDNRHEMLVRFLESPKTPIRDRVFAYFDLRGYDALPSGHDIDVKILDTNVHLHFDDEEHMSATFNGTTVVFSTRVTEHIVIDVLNALPHWENVIRHMITDVETTK